MYNMMKMEYSRGKYSFEILNWILSHTLQFKFEHVEHFICIYIFSKYKYVSWCVKQLSILLLILLFFFFQCVQMAHALRRISYATCEPQHAQFSFLAREPRAHFSIQYCHSFITESAEQVSGYFSFFQPRLDKVSFYVIAIVISYKNYEN